MSIFERVLSLLHLGRKHASASGSEATPKASDKAGAPSSAGALLAEGERADTGVDDDAWEPGFSIFISRDKMHAFLRMGVAPPTEDEQDGSQAPRDELDDEEATTDELQPANEQSGSSGLEFENWEKDPLDMEGVYELLDEAGVIYGYDEKAIAAAVEQAKAAPPTPFSIEVAKGTQPVPAKPPTLELGFRMEIHDPHGTAVELIELVEPDRVVARIMPGEPAIEKLDVTGGEFSLPTSPTIVLVASQGAYVSDDRSSAIATVVGYPSIKRNTTRTETRIVIGVEPVVKVSNDHMEAQAQVYKAVGGAEELTLKKLTELTKQAGVVHGTLPGSMSTICKMVQAGAPQATMVIALGDEAVPGEDAKVEFAVDIGPRPGTLMPDGSIDFRQRIIFQEITEDTLIARKVPATEGSEGHDVYGEVRQPTPGQDIKLEAEGDARYDRDTHELRATKDGVLTLVGDRRIRVSAKQTINGDVDFGTGNIRSNGCVEVRGSVLSGFELTASGDVLVQGMVENAKIESGGNVSIRGGVKGRNARVMAEGDVDLHYLEGGRAFSGGVTVVRRGLVQARVHAYGDVRCEKGSKVIGGQIIAGGDVTLDSAGSGRSGSAMIAAAVSPANIQRYYDLQRELASRESAVNTHYARFGSSVDNDTIRSLRKKLETSRAAWDALDLQPGGVAAAAQLASISVQNRVHEATTIRIGNAELVLQDELESKRFTTTADGRSILILEPNEEHSTVCEDSDPEA